MPTTTTVTVMASSKRLHLPLNSLNSYHPIYRLAKSYGLIAETGVPVVFYFEKVNS